MEWELTKTRFWEGGREYRFAYKSSSNFLNEREARAVDFVLFSAAKSTVSIELSAYESVC